jgi:Bacterial SH3 domain
MKRIYKVLALLLISNLSFCQEFEFAIIQDKDGFTNVREEANLKSKIVGTAKNDELIFVFDNEENKDWLMVETSKITGFVHKSRINRLKSYSEINPSNQSDNNIRFKNNYFSIDIFSEKFNQKKYTLIYEIDHRFIKLLNGKKFYGTDGPIPKIALKSINLKIGQKLISINKNLLEDLFEPNFDNTQVFLDKPTQTIYLSMHNSDGAGGYSVAWVFKPNQDPKRFVLNTN